MWALEPGTHHLNHGSFGAVLEEVLDLQQEWRRRFEANPSRFVFHELDGAVDRARDAVARFVGADPAGTFFHYPAYLKLYWEEFGEAPEHLLLSFAEEESGEQVGAGAFERIGRTLRFLGGTEVTDYMGPVAKPGCGEPMAKELFAGLVLRKDWDEADLRGLPTDTAWLELLRAGAEDQGLAVEVAEDQNGLAPYLELPASWDGYLASLPSKLRHEIRRLDHYSPATPV